MLSRKSFRSRGLLWPAMISLILARRAHRGFGVVSAWTVLTSSTHDNKRPLGKFSAFQRPVKLTVAATVQGREYNTTDKTFAAATTGIPGKVKIRSPRTPRSNSDREVDKATTNSTEKWTEDNWKENPELNPTLTFPTWAVPLENASIIQSLLSSELTQPFLATRDEHIQQCHPRPKIVQDGTNPDGSRTHKYILLHPSHADHSMPAELADLLGRHNVELNGPNVSISIQYQQFPVSYILQKLLPPSAHPPPTAFETIGHVAHLNLKDAHAPFAKVIGHVLLDCIPAIETVIQKVGQVSGPYRTYDYELLAGRNDTTVKLQEHGIKLEFDLSKVYWCSRLAQERQVILDQEIKPKQVVADAFCGVGAICLRAAQTKNCIILANDWNPHAIHYLQKNFESNKLSPYLAAATNQDAYDFLMDLGFHPPYEEKESTAITEPSNALATHVVDHVLLNFPLKAHTFLGALRWWAPPLSENSPRLHVYTFSRADPETGRTAEEVAVDLIASELLPAFPSSSSSETCWRLRELNEDFGCQVVAREVRDVAPGKLVLCVSFTATPKLLQHMQGNFID